MFMPKMASGLVIVSSTTISRSMYQPSGSNNIKSVQSPYRNTVSGVCDATFTSPDVHFGNNYLFSDVQSYNLIPTTILQQISKVFKAFIKKVFRRVKNSWCREII